MIHAGLALLAMLQGPALDVTAAVDRARVAVGEEVTLTIQVHVQGAEAPRFDLPLLAGFAVVGTRDASEVALHGAAGASRTTLRALTLRAERPGRLTIGPVGVHVGDAVATTPPFTIVVDSAAAFPTATLTPVARALLAAAPPPARGDQVALSVALPTGPAAVGQQLDLVLAAWFPRALRERLRRPPLLTLLTPEDVWGYPPSAPPDVVMSRDVHGQSMDLYAVHQILFPLTAGRIVIPPASVEYAVPVNFSFFSSEERYSLATDSVIVSVQPLPAAGRPTDDQGVIAESLQLNVVVTPPEGRVGEPLEVTSTLRGTGNVALWSPPLMRWPPGFRSYPEETTVRIETPNGLVGGTKTFHYLVVPDSAGVFLLPEVRYPYFDPATGYHVIDIGARSLVAAPGGEPRAARALPELLAPGSRDWSDRVTGELWPAGWLTLGLVPLLVLFWLMVRGRIRPHIAEARALDAGQLGRLERQFMTLLQAHVADAYSRDAASLARALRAAGVDRTLAEHVGRLRDRMRRIRYGPRGSGDPLELAAELHQVLQALMQGGQSPRRRRLTVGLGVFVLALAGGTHGASGQGTSAEALYQAGALRAAADSFAARAASDTLDPAHWYDLGATLYRSGEDGRAVAAWVLAERLAPRNGLIRRARDLLPPPDAASAKLLNVGFATPGEWALFAGVWWIACWTVVFTLSPRGRNRVVAAALAAGALAAALQGQVERRRRDRPVAVIVSPRTPVRAAPYGSSSASLVLDPGAAVLVIDRFAGGRWLRIRRPDGVNGWVLAGQLVRL